MNLSRQILSVTFAITAGTSMAIFIQAAFFSHSENWLLFPTTPTSSTGCT
jgi:hypothetical protein